MAGGGGGNGAGISMNAPIFVGAPASSRHSLTQWLSLFCCPPWPSSVASKLAFLPPRPASYEVMSMADESYQFRLRTGRVLDPRIFETFFVKTRRNNNLCCLHVKINPNAPFTILHSHGNAVDLGIMAFFYLQLGRGLGCNVLGYDYSGYGASSGQATERNVYADVEAAYNSLVNLYHLKPNRVIAYGQSIGTVPTVYLASKIEKDLAAVVLHSALSSGLGVACPWMQKTRVRGCLSCCDVFRSIDRANGIRALTLVVHGEQDEVVNIRHGVGIYECLQTPARPFWVPQAGHNDIELQPAFSERLRTFIDYEVPAHLNQTDTTEALISK